MSRLQYMKNNVGLASIPLFANLSPSQLDLIAAALERRAYRAGEDIFLQGSAADGMIIVESGEAVLFRSDPDGSQQALATITAGESINQEALFKDAVHSATMRAAQPLIALKLTRASFTRLLEQQPELGAAFGLGWVREQAQISPQFAEQREDEEILIQTRRHWWSFLRSAWLPLLLLLAMWGGAFLLEVQVLSLALLGLSVLLPGAALAYFYLEWRNDAVIVTDQRIIRINRTILTMVRQVTQVGLESVHEINFEFPSYDPFARLFRYGKVLVKTAGAQGNLELDFMPNPEQFQKLIIEDRAYFESRQAQRHHKIVRAELQRWLAGDNEDAAAAASFADSDEAPKPIRGANGFLSSRIEMSNGDIVYRKHLSVWAQHTFIPLAIILVALASLALSLALISPDLRIITMPVGLVALLIGCLAFYWMDWDWRNDLYIISDDTITLVHKRPFFLQSLRDQILVERIDNVESMTRGILAALLKYGDVRMSLVGADEPKMFHRVSKPQEIQQEISRRQHQKAERRARYDAMQQRQILGEYLDTVNGGSAPNATEAALPSANSFASEPFAPEDGAVRPASNPDRNRPPRLPRKVMPAAPRASHAPQDIERPTSRRRPGRFRSDGSDPA